MSKPFQFLHNGLALFALVGIMVVSLFTTLSLSPVAVGNGKSNQVAGLSVSHNVTPIQATALVSTFPEIQTSIQNPAPGEYNFNMNIAPQKQQFLDLNAFRLINSSNSPTSVTIQAIVPQSIGSYLNLGIIDAGQTYGLYNGLDNQSRTVTVTVPANSNLTYTLKFETTSKLSFGGSLVLQIRSK